MKQIKNYIGKEVAVQCSSQEEWNKIIELISEVKSNHGPTQKYLYNNLTQETIDCLNLKMGGIPIGASSKDNYLKNGYIVFPASDFLEEESKFEEGKWYKSKDSENLYRNISRNEVIWSIGRFEENYSVKETFENWELLTDLSEIQQFLPKGHADKIKTEVIPQIKKITIMKFKVGDEVEFIDSSSKNARYFKKGLSNLIIKLVNDYANIYTVYESDKSTSWNVEEHELRLMSTKNNYKKDDYIYVLGGETTTGRNCKSKVVKILYTDGHDSKKYANTDYSDCGGIWFDDFRLATATEIDTLYIHKKSKTLLEEARERYPIGTHFNCVKDNAPAVVQEELKEDMHGAIYTRMSGSNFNQYVYVDDKWANKDLSYKVTKYVKCIKNLNSDGERYKKNKIYILDTDNKPIEDAGNRFSYSYGHPDFNDYFTVATEKEYLLQQNSNTNNIDLKLELTELEIPKPIKIIKRREKLLLNK